MRVISWFIEILEKGRLIEMSNVDLPTPREECEKCPVYKRMVNFSDGLFVKNAEISKMQESIMTLKKDVRVHSKKLESIEEQLKQCQDQNRKLKELADKIEVVSNYYAQEFSKIKTMVTDALRAQGIPLPEENSSATS